MAESNNASVAERWDAVMMANYGTPKLLLTRGEGARVWDEDSNEYLDLLGGIATSSLGHAHPAVSAAVAAQASQLIHTSNLYAHEPGLRLAEQLVELVGVPSKVFFSQDGATANEAAYKLARRHGRNVDPDGGKLEIIAAHRSFHGRTMGALSITGSPPKQDPFLPLPGPVTFVPYGDSGAMAQAISSKTAAVFIEPIMGEAGVVIPPPDYLAGLRALCTANDALLVVDEVQSGMGRTGAWFASIDQGVMPDVITLAKGVASGMPLGVCIGIGAAGDLFVPGNHGTTFGGNPVTCAAAYAVIQTIANEDVLGHVKRLSEHWLDELSAIDHPRLESVRGSGLWIALQLDSAIAKHVEEAARQQGFLVNAVAPDAIRLAPPLILTQDQADAFTHALPEILTIADSETGNGQDANA